MRQPSRVIAIGLVGGERLERLADLSACRSEPSELDQPRFVFLKPKSKLGQLFLEEMVFDAHERAFALFKGVRGRGVYGRAAFNPLTDVVELKRARRPIRQLAWTNTTSVRRVMV
jgi:hypothetical protein